MRRAVTLIVVLTVLCLGLGLWLDLTQRHTAREYLDALDVVRTEVLETVWTRRRMSRRTCMQDGNTMPAG